MMIIQPGVVLDACCIINIHASGRMADILKAFPVPVVIAEVVRRQELLSIQSLDALNLQGSSFQAVVEDGLIEVLDFESEEEKANFIDYVAVLGDDGEAATFAIAAARGYAVATDDRRARSFAERELPQLRLIYTLDLVRHWADTRNSSSSELQDALRKIKKDGRYIPHKAHPLYEWWVRAIDT